ncbi:MAG: substrate-binding domain-containing protein, partial [bacterium]|nr:substrate-binding domain-containing protein [bacterium]
ERVPYLIYIGSDESQGGVAAADQILARMMPARAACINKLPDHAAVNVRCAGWTETMKAAGVPVDLVDVSGGPAKAEATLSAYLRSHPDTDAFLTATSGANDYGLTLAALSETGMRGGEAALVTFDLTPKVLDSIKAGDTLAAIDQQPYLQGYLSAVLARQYLDAGLMPVGDILTGPSVVNADNIDQVLAGTALGRR